MGQVRQGDASPGIRVAIVAKYTLMRQSLSALIDREPDLEVVWSTPTTGEAMDCFRASWPDVVLLDGDLPEYSPADLANRIVSEKKKCQIVVLAASVCAVRLQEALDADVSGYVLKDDSSDTILTAIRGAIAGRRVWSPTVESHLRFDTVSGQYAVSGESPTQRLTSRQLEIVVHLAHGASAKEVARRLHVSAKTISSHAYRIMKQLNIHDRVELTRFAIREGLVAP